MSDSRSREPRDYDLYLSYSGRRKFLNCGYSYELEYVRRLPVVRDPTDSLFGSIIGRVVEVFYRDSLWARPDVVRACLNEIGPAMTYVFSKEKFDADANRDYVRGLRAELELYVPPSIRTIQAHRLVAPVSRAELDLSVVHGTPETGVRIKIGGRTDIALQFDRETSWILDGKASKHRERYADAEQLIWYAVQYYLKFHVVPTRIGFIYWRFPNDPVQWIDLDEEKLRRSLATTVQAAKDILAKKFAPNPNPACTLCPYRSKCPEGTRYVAAKKVAEGGRIEESIFDIEPI